MSAPPPPFPPSPSTHPPQSDGWSRRATREQQRAALAYARQQRAARRQEARYSRRRSTFGPVLLILLGVTLLLVQSGVISWGAALSWMVHWWPVVLVGAGLLLLTEWAFDTGFSGSQAGPYRRRTLGVSGAIVLCVLLIAGPAAAAALHGAHWAEQHWSLPAGLGLDEVLAKHSETSQDLQAPFPAGAQLSIQNTKGNISVTGSSQDGQIHISVHQRMWAWQSSELAENQRRDRPVLAPSGAGLRLQVGGAEHDQSDLTIELPHEASVEIGAEQGDVAISELRGNVHVLQHQGGVVLTALNGDVHISSRDDDASLSGHSLSGALLLDGHSGDISLSDVTGPVTLHGDFYGTTHLERIGGSVRFQSVATDFTCAGIPGEFTVEGRSELEANRLLGPVDLATTDRDITLLGVERGVSVKNRHGAVTLSFADLTGPIRVGTTDGGVTIRVPNKSPFHVEAETVDGEVSTDFGLRPQAHGDRVSLVGQVLSGGPAMQLRTTEGDIKIRNNSRTEEGQAAESDSKEDDD